jgi:proteic killer suppression protein
MCYNCFIEGCVVVILTFLDKETQKIFKTGKSKALPINILKRARNKLMMLDAAKSLNDLSSPPGNNLETLTGNLKNFYSIRINAQYRIIFMFENGNAHKVTIVDYHK